MLGDGLGGALGDKYGCIWGYLFIVMGGIASGANNGCKLNLITSGVFLGLPWVRSGGVSLIIPSYHTFMRGRFLLVYTR